VNDNRGQYDALKRLSWSRLRLLEKSPAHYRHGVGDDSSGFALGTAAHMAVLEPERFAMEYVVYPGRRAGKAWEAFEAEHLAQNKQILNQREYDAAIAIRNAVRSHSRATSYLRGGAAEQTLTWALGEFECKGRADYIGDAVVDLKSTKDGSPKAFAAACARYGYFGQAAWYSDGLFLATGKRKPFVIVAVESSAPHVVTVYRVPDAVLAAGREQYLTLLGRLSYCMKNSFWGGYSEQEEIDLEIPQWVSTEEA
jgi:hypothetical protein